MPDKTTYRIADFGPADLLTTEEIGLRRVKVSGDAFTSAFGEIVNVSPKPVVQVTAQYGLRDEVETVTIFGTADSVDSKFRVSTGANPFSIATIASKRLATYRAGQGLMCRFSAIFTEGQANSSQIGGLVTSESLLGFGYNGTEFGIVRATNGELEQWELQITSGAAGAENATITIDNTPYVVPLTAGTPQLNAWEISQSLNDQAVGYGFSSVGDTVVVLGQLPDLGGGVFAFSSATAAAAFTQIQSGTLPPEVWIPKSEWNVRPDIDIDPTLGNVYQIQMQYLGFGGLSFFIEDPKTARFELVHVIRYANTSTLPSFTNPIFRVGWGVRNSGNATDIVIESASGAIFIEGDTYLDTDTVGESITQIGIGTTRTSILSLQNRRTYNLTANRAEIIIRSIVLSTDTTKTGRFFIIKNPITASGDFLEFNDLGPDNLGQISTSTAEIVGGDVIAAYNVKASAPFSVDVDAVLSQVQPADIICIAANVSSGSASEMDAAITWQDDL